VSASREAARSARDGRFGEAVGLTDIDLKSICTSYVERNNLTIRRFIKRFTRLTPLPLQEKNLAAAVAMHIAYYNSCRVHGSLRITPVAGAAFARLFHARRAEGIIAIMKSPKSSPRIITHSPAPDLASFDAPMQHRTSKTVYPLMIVLASISLIETAMTVLYPRVQSVWERVPLLVVIVGIPATITAAFVYLWIKRPGHLYPPTEFGIGVDAGNKLAMFGCGNGKADSSGNETDKIDAEYLVE